MVSLKKVIQDRFEQGYTFDEILNEKIHQKNREDQLLNLIEDDVVKIDNNDYAFGGLMIGDFVYDSLRLDPAVIDAADFSRAEDITNLFEFSSFSGRMSSQGIPYLDGNIHNLKGYVGEQLVAQQLQAQGYEVEFPSTSNNEGYDLLVNGEKFQVKISADGSSIRKHLAENPDIPVITNIDIPESLVGHPSVFPMDGITEQGLENITRDSIDAGVEVFDLEIPAIVSAIAIGKNTYRLLKGDTDLKAAGLNAGVEVVARGGGAFLGSKILGIMGASLGPYGVIVGGMVGAVVGGSTVHRWSETVKQNYWLSEETAALKKSIKEFLERASLSSQKSRIVFERKVDKLINNLDRLGNEMKPLRDFVSKRIEKERIYLDDQIFLLGKAVKDPMVLVPSYVKNPTILYISGQAVVTAMKAKVHPYSVDQELKKLTSSVEKYQSEYDKL